MEPSDFKDLILARPKVKSDNSIETAGDPNESPNEDQNGNGNAMCDRNLEYLLLTPNLKNIKKSLKYEQQQNLKHKKKLNTDTDDVDDTEWGPVETMVHPNYYNIFECNKAPSLNTTVPIFELTKPDGFILTDQNIHITPFGSTLISWDGNKMFDVELTSLKSISEDQDGKILGIHQLLDLPVNDTTICALCGSPANSKCCNCLTVGYCCREHQIEDWKNHRPHCVLHKIVQDDKTGEYIVVAKANIKKGEAIYIEEPYFVTPYSDDEHLNLMKFSPISKENRNMPIGKYTVEQYLVNICRLPPVCLGCNVYLDPEGTNVVSCKDCGWPTCGRDCCGLEIHKNLECVYFKQKRLDYEACYKTALLPPTLFGFIRGLILKKADESKWAKISGQRSPAWDEKIRRLVRVRANAEYLLVVLKTVFRFKEVSYEDVMEILHLIDIKGIYGSMTENLGRESVRRLTAVYHTTSLIQHRCVGNVIVFHLHPATVHVVASANIKKGEVLYRNYNKLTDGDNMLNSFQRQRFSLSEGNMFCDCGFCTNLTEAEKSLSAIVCLKCKRRGVEGFMVVENFSVVDSPWKCNKCGARKLARQVRTSINAIINEIEGHAAAANSGHFNNGLTALSYEYEVVLRNALEIHRGIDLHPDHSIIVATECDLIFLLMNDTRMQFIDVDDCELLRDMILNRIKNLGRFLPEMHSSIVSMKVRLAMVVFQHVCRLSVMRRKDLGKAFDELQNIYNDVASSFVENTKRNALQGYILFCLRHLRVIMTHIKEIYLGSRRVVGRSIPITFPALTNQ